MKFGIIPKKEDTIPWQVQGVRHCGKLRTRIDQELTLIYGMIQIKEIINKNT